MILVMFVMNRDLTRALSDWIDSDIGDLLTRKDQDIDREYVTQRVSKLSEIYGALSTIKIGEPFMFIEVNNER